MDVGAPLPQDKNESARPPAASDAQAELQWNEGSGMAANQQPSASPSKDENRDVSPQPPLMTPQAKPAPEPLPEIKPVDSAATLAAMSPMNPPPPSTASDAVRPTQTGSAAQQEAVEQPVPSTSRDETTVAGRQPAPASPASDSLSAESKVSGTDPAAASTGSNASLAAATADPQTTAKPDTEAGNNTQPDQATPDSPPEPPAIAKADTNLQALNEPVDDDTPAGEPPDVNVLEKRLRAFLQDYCTTYAARNMGAFSSFFAPYAEENGQPFASLIPKYQRNFNLIEAIEYRIELQEFSSDETNQTVKIEGDFFLKWLPPDKQWRENSGKIYMNLKADGSSFLVQQLDYHGSRAKTE
ncbi:hypothetical protein [Desulfosarcina sp.]|uniref:hypothetical protein n=1 Tax=Desulfosarcina sp. TaxID=2027861 RepID=UPI003970D614